MSLNPNTRTHTLEVLMNEAEMTGLATVSKAMGIARSTWARLLINEQVRAHRSPPPPARESRGCRGGRPASRASVGMRRQV